MRQARVGIDFGTSSTVAVVAAPGREPRPLLFDGSPLLPSAVCVDPTGRILTGRDALYTAMATPSAFEPHPKQRVDEGTVLLAGTDVEVPRLFEAVLGRVMTEATNVTDSLTDQPPEVVVTCPAAWGNARRDVLLGAAPPSTRLVDEPVAAAHYFVDIAGNHIPDGGTAVIYDFGAGTFDAAVVRRDGDTFATVASRGVPDCGGLDIDAAIVAYLAEAGADADAAGWARLEQPTTAADRRARQQLWDNVRAAKEMLSRTTSTLIQIPLLDVNAPLGREELDRLALPILDRTVTTVKEVLEVAGVRIVELSAIFLSGGSSRMPAVVTRLHQAFGVPPVTVDQPELAVAEGSLRAVASAGTGPRDGAQARPAPVPAPGARWIVTRLTANRRRIALVTVAVVVIVGLTAAVLLAPRHDRPVVPSAAEASGKASASPSPSPSYRRGVDPCLLGTWRVTVDQVYGLIGHVQVSYSGGAGTVVVYRADGTFAIDYNKSQPRTARFDGATWSDLYRGTASGRYYAENGVITSTTEKRNTTDVVRRNGKVNVTSKGSSFPEPEQYRCSGNDLYSYSAQGSYSTHLVRVSGP